ncbi:uncharacterized protein LOC111711894 isoform X3 [Eurytemora carolleeae]|uniref:uncharacterized protein LOC111711894 isoform X3 n=1 Tax=Eurytemora carolleeae TaxID=1294199 RepID=UPI000C770326|nr:uncharacterized protein LOC111711894 isoform X3 [Eurytemora carolleeae]|eukprot:XP_023342126.1 uncharacterized protein LOC111711894 isoform X3 [Eurytemora affinis]
MQRRGLVLQVLASLFCFFIISNRIKLKEIEFFPGSSDVDNKCSCGEALSGTQLDAIGGWILNEETIRKHHVRFDDGLGREILRIVREKTPGKEYGERIRLGDIGAGVGQFGEWINSQENISVEWTGLDGGSNVNTFCGKNVSLRDQKIFKVPKVCFFDASIHAKSEDLVKLGAPFDWVISIEVGEHIPSQYQLAYIDNLIRVSIFDTDNLIRMSKIGIILSWAVPGQGGQGHVNEKSNKAVVKLFEDRGLFYLHKVSDSVRRRVDRLNWLRW